MRRSLVIDGLSFRHKVEVKLQIVRESRADHPFDQGITVGPERDAGPEKGGGEIGLRFFGDGASIGKFGFPSFEERQQSL